jgi:hypothetical protein
MPVKYSIGGIVLVGTVRRSNLPKLFVTWLGPYRSVRFEHQQVLEEEHLLSGKRKKVHVTRVKFYRDASLEVTEELISFLEYHDSIFFVVENLIALRQIGEDVQGQAKWFGFDDSESTWEPVSTMSADVPGMLRSFVNGQGGPLVDKVKTFLR